MRALERAGYRLVPELEPDDTASYRDSATPSLSLRFVFPRRGNHRPAVKTLRIWRADARTMAYAVVCEPLWLLQAAGVFVGIVSILAAILGNPAHRPWVPGLIAAGILFGLPKLWLDDMRHLLRDALEETAAADAAPGPVKARQRVGPVAEPGDPEELGEEEEEMEKAARRADEGD